MADREKIKTAISEVWGEHLGGGPLPLEGMEDDIVGGCLAVASYIWNEIGDKLGGINISSKITRGMNFGNVIDLFEEEINKVKN